MSIPDLTAKLPPPHDEEPTQLRSDILDELQDHLICAADRERRRLELNNQPVDAITIWQSVIERFGDPSVLARRLWFDAMKGRLMTQRIFLGAVLVLVSLLIVTMWRMNTTLASTIDQNQKATAAILERLEKEVPAASTVASPEWIPVKITLVKGTADGEPCVGQEVSLQQQTEGNRLGQMTERTDSHGIADFGSLPYGRYNFWTQTGGLSYNETFVLKPGRPFDLRIIIPNDPQPVPVAFDFALPDWEKWGWDSRFGKPDGEPCLLIRYGLMPSVDIDNRTWSGSRQGKSIVVRQDGIYTVTSELGVNLDANNNPFDVPPTEYQENNHYFGDLTIDLNSRTEKLPIMPGNMRYSAEWCYVTTATAPGKNEIVLRKVTSSRLTADFVGEMFAKAQESPEKFPRLVVIGSDSHSPIQHISIPVNDPGTHDGICPDPEPLIQNQFSGGGQGIDSNSDYFGSGFGGGGFF